MSIDPCKSVVLLLGMPGAGKTTSGTILAERLGIPFLSLGDVLRAGLASGQIFPGSDPATGFLRLELERSSHAYVSGLILDFSPVQPNAFLWLEEMLRECAFDIRHVVHVHAKLEEAMERFVRRGRRSNDPLDEDPRHRFLRRVELEFNSFTLPLLDHAREANKLYVLENLGDLENCRRQSFQVADAIREQGL